MRQYKSKKMKAKSKVIRKIVFRSTLLIALVWYYNCIPFQLFDDPVSLVVLDRNNELLSAHVAADHQWRFPETAVINDKFLTALITFEDKRFYNHMGVDVLALGRAIKYNLSDQRVVSGASTLSMQVIRLSRKNPRRTYFEKITEMLRATRLEMRYSKNQILSFYASHAPFGGNVVGLEAASWKYFGRSQDKLSWAEAAMLAVLPNAPSLIHPGKNRAVLLDKRNRLLDRLAEKNEIDSLTCALAKCEPLPDKPLPINNKSAHMMDCFLKKGKQGKVKTTIDGQVQEKVNSLLKMHAEKLQSMAVYNAATLVIDVKTGELISYVGNISDGKKRNNNDVDMLQARRSTGSILKPFLYAEMLDQGMILPKTLIRDVPVDYTGYNPKNYHLTFDGVVPANEMVSRSLNIPAVNMLNQYGVNKFANNLRSYGLSTIDKAGVYYGLPLILGGAEVTPWELAQAYTTAMQKLSGYDREISMLSGNTNKNPLMSSLPEKTAIYQMVDAMLEVSRPSANKSWKIFSSPNKIAWKTGTSFGGRDAWAVGCNTNYVVVVWAGNADGEGRPNLTGFNAASPILFDVFNVLPSSDEWFKMPIEESIKVYVCRKSGQKANAACQQYLAETVSQKGKDSEMCQFCHKVALDSTGKFLVEGTDYPPLERTEKTFFILDPVVASYYKKKKSNYSDLPKAIANVGNIEVVYPSANSKIYLPKVTDEDRSSFIVKAASSDAEDELHWTLDDDYIGRTKNNHQLAIKSDPGDHTLSVVNRGGDRVYINFEIVN